MGSFSQYAIGRQHSTSLPEDYWQQLVAPDVKKATSTHYADFAPIKRLKTQHYPQKTSPPRHRISLITALLRILHADELSKTSVQVQFELLSKRLQTQSEEILFQWIQHVLFIADNKISTARRYIGAIGREWLLAAAQQPLDAYTGEDFYELYQTILSRPQSQKNREFNADRLMQLHQFCVQRYQFPSLPQALIETSQEDEIQCHVCAGYVSEPLFSGLLNHIALMTDLNTAEQITLQTFLIISYRTGLRPGEVAKLQMRDLEPSETGCLFVQENRFGHNKTDAALRKVPLFPLLTYVEKAIVDKHFQTRRIASAPLKSLLLCAENNGYEPLDTAQIALIAQAILKDLSGGGIITDFIIYATAHYPDYNSSCITSY